MPTLLKYLLLQLPQWLGLALLLWFLVERTTVPRWVGIGFLIVWVVKDLVVYPFIRYAYEGNTKAGTEQLIGNKGVASERLAPEGYIKIQGELWKAQAKHDPIPQDEAVKVTGARGMTLIVEAESKGH